MVYSGVEQTFGATRNYADEVEFYSAQKLDEILTNFLFVTFQLSQNYMYDLF